MGYMEQYLFLDRKPSADVNINPINHILDLI